MKVTWRTSIKILQNFKNEQITVWPSHNLVSPAPYIGQRALFTRTACIMHFRWIDLWSCWTELKLFLVLLTLSFCKAFKVSTDEMSHVTMFHTVWDYCTGWTKGQVHCQLVTKGTVKTIEQLQQSDTNRVGLKKRELERTRNVDNEWTLL